MRALLLTVVMIGLLPSTARAQAYPWVPFHADLKLIADPKVDLAVRLHLIAQARRSIEIVLYEQGDDPDVGLPLLSGLRHAANRGVAVRVLTQWAFQYVAHPFNNAPDFLTNPPAARPVEYVRFGVPLSVIANGMHPSDGVHGKLLLVDGTTALITGRGHTNASLVELDATFVVRGALVLQASKLFEALWRDGLKLGDVYEFSSLHAETPEQRTILEPTQRVVMDATGRAALEDVLQWMSAAPPTVATGRARLLHFNFLHQMAALSAHGLASWRWQDRQLLLEDPIAEAFVARVRTAHDVRFSSMYPMLTQRVQNALETALRGGASVSVLTNGPGTAPPVSTFAFLASRRQVQRLAWSGAEVHLIDAGVGRPWRFVHLKLAIVDDTVLLGSHNLNLASSAFNDEIDVEVEDAAFAATTRRFFDAQVEANTSPFVVGEDWMVDALGAAARLSLEPLLGFW